MTKSDKQFLEQLEESHIYVRQVANWLMSKGYDVKINPASVRENYEDRWEHTDDGDLEVRLRIEVKHRKLDFNGPDDYPYDTVLLDECYKVDGREASLYGYVILNKDASVAAVASKSTMNHWVRERKYVRDDGEERDSWACPVELCTFHQLPLITTNLI